MAQRPLGPRDNGTKKVLKSIGKKRKKVDSCPLTSKAPKRRKSKKK